LAAKLGRAYRLSQLCATPRGGAATTARVPPRTSSPSRQKLFAADALLQPCQLQALVGTNSARGNKIQRQLVPWYLHVSRRCGAPEWLRFERSSWPNTLTSAAAVKLAVEKLKRIAVGMNEPFPHGDLRRRRCNWPVVRIWMTE
jgi:hypothetical protein